MRRARAALMALETPSARARVVRWLSDVMTQEAPPAPAQMAANQLTLDDAAAVFP